MPISSGPPSVPNPYPTHLSATQRALRLPEILATIAYWTEPAEAIECLRVCRAWHGHFLPIVWRSLALFRHDILEAPPDPIVAAHGRMVQDLALYIYPRESPEVLERLERFALYMVRLQELKFRIVGGTDSYFAIARQWLVANRKTLRRMCWSTTRDARKPTRILEAKQYFPSTSAPSQENHMDGSDDTEEGVMESNGYENKDRGGMERLESLTLEGWDLTMANLWHLLYACPRLSFLALHRNHFLDHGEQDDDHHNGNNNNDMIMAEQYPPMVPQETHAWPHQTTAHPQHYSTPLRQLHQHLFPGVRTLQTEGEMPPMLLLNSFPNLEQWIARELVDLDSRRLAQQIQCSNMCSTLTYLDLQRAFSPDIMLDDDDDDDTEGDDVMPDDDDDGEEVEAETDNQVHGPYQNGGGSTTHGDLHVSTNSSPATNIPHATMEDTLPGPTTTGPDDHPSNIPNNYAIDLIPVLRAIHKDTLRVLRLSRCMLSAAGLRVLCEQHGQSLEELSLDYVRKPPRRQRRPPSQPPPVQLIFDMDATVVPSPSPLYSSTPSPLHQNNTSNSNNSSNVLHNISTHAVSVGSTDTIDYSADATTTTATHSDMDTDLYLNIILESCPNLQSLRVWQRHRSYGSVRLWTTAWLPSSLSSSSCSSSSAGLPRSSSPPPPLRLLLRPSPAWVCTNLRELEVQIDDWVSLSTPDHASAAIERLFSEETSVVESGTRSGIIAGGQRRVGCDHRSVLPNPSVPSWMDETMGVSAEDLSTQQVKGRLRSLPRLERSSLVVGNIIGAGGYGHVYDASWKGRKVAVKKFFVVHDDVRQSAAIQREIDILKTLADRYIIQFYGTAYHE
ncbi:hypothetical protein BGZ73_003274, partial [Actinomortierella ambigua]